MAEGNTAPAAELPASALPAGQPDYVEKTIAATHSDPVPAQTAAQIAADGRPANVPEQFWDAEKKAIRTEDVLKSYAELRAKMDGKAAEEKPSEDKPADEAADKGKLKIDRKDEKAAEGETPPLTAAVETLAKAYEETGEFPEEQIKALEALGLPRKVVDVYKAGLAALEVTALTEVHRAAGGEEVFTAAQEWAKASLSDADLAYYNDNVDDPSKRVQTVEWLVAKFKAARPSEGNLIEGKPSTAAAGDVYTSQAEVARAMADPNYKVSEGYRKQVAEKLLRSRRAGTLTNTTEFFTR